MAERDTLKVARIFEEFPWLSKHTSASWTAHANISRLDTETMHTLPHLTWGDDFMLLLDKDGNKIAEVGIRYGRFLSALYDEGMKTYENIVDTLLRIGDAEAEKVVFAIHKDGSQLTVYKMPKTFPTMKAWVAELKRRADNAVKQQLATIDEEAVTAD